MPKNFRYLLSCFLVKQNKKSGLSKFFPKAEWDVTEPQIFTASEQSLKAEVQKLHWKLGQQVPSFGTILAYLETTA